MRVFYVATALLLSILCFSSSAIASSNVTELRKAIIYGDTAKIDKLVKNGLDKKIIQSHLSYAVGLNHRHDNVEVIKSLIHHGAEVTLEKNSGNNLLIEALRIGDFKLIKLLVDNGANVKLINKGRNLLQLAVHITYTGPEEHLKDINQRRLKIVNYLVSLGIYKIDSELLLNALNSSQDPSELGIVQIMIKNGLNLNQLADVNVLDKNNPFLSAAKKGHLETVKLFIKHGVNPAFQSKAGTSALSSSIRAYKKDVALYLLKNKTSFTSNQLKKAIESAMDLGLKDITSLLLSYGVKPGLEYICDDCIYQSNSFPGEGIPTLIANKSKLTLNTQPALNTKKSLENFIIGNRINFDKVVYRTTKSSRVLVLKNIPAFMCGNESVDLKKGDFIEYLQYRAEGYMMIRAKGIICEAFLDNGAFKFLDKSPITELWLRIINEKNNRLGWYLIDNNSDDIRFGDRQF